MSLFVHSPIRWIHACLVLFFVVCSAPLTFVQAEPLTAESLQNLGSALRSNLGSISPSVAIAIQEMETGKMVFSQNSELPLKPASILKIVTSAVGFDRLGPTFRFETRAYATDVSSGRVGGLYVRGGGDPSFTTESMWVFVRRLKQRGVKVVGNLYIDDSAFLNPLPRSGARAYQAGSSATSLNHNTLGFEVCPSAPSSAAHVESDPWEAGTKINGSIGTVSAKSKGYSIDELKDPNRGNLSYRVSGSISARQGCEFVYRSVPDPASYFGKVLSAFLETVGIRVHGEVRYGQAPKSAVLIYKHLSKTLSEVIRDLNLYSSNFAAEQILTILGKSAGGIYDRQKGLQTVGAYLDQLGFEPGEYRLFDASGLNHDNRISARIILRLLKNLVETESYRPDFEFSLPVGGRSGTLKSRSLGPSNMVVRAKTGTLNGVVSLAGYMESKSGRKYSFVIIQNNVQSVSTARKRERTVLSVLYKY